MKLTLQLFAMVLYLLSGAAQAFQVTDENGVITVTMPDYRLTIIKQGFRYGFTGPDGTTMAPPHAHSGLEFAGGEAVGVALRSPGPQQMLLDVTNDRGEHAAVMIEPADHYVHFSVTPSLPGRIVARLGGLSPVFGLGDHASVKRTTTDVSGFVDDYFRAQEPLEHKRLISNFLIAPRSGVAAVNMEKGVKIVHVTADETAQGSLSVTQMPALYYFLGTPAQIYAAYLQVRNQEGYPVLRPKYELFGVGWEAFGALGWKTNEKTVTENVDRYLSLGYPLEWMVVGSGFWPNEDPRLCATTSFGMWDHVRYPDPKKFIAHFKDQGLKFLLGLRIAFIHDGPYAAEGLARGYFLTKDGHAQAWQLEFPHRPAYLLDGTNPGAVKWYLGLCQKWRDYGVDGFKEDLFSYRVANMREGNIDQVNRALMDEGVYIIGRNGYLGSAMDTHRIEDFNFQQNQDRGPINALAFAYSGFPCVYPDTCGGTFGEGRAMPPLDSPQVQHYMMRVAQFDLVNPSMAMGMGPWNFGSPQVEQVMLAAAQLHARLHPYIYSAAMDAFATGFPWTLAPLPLVFPQDPQVYGRENTTVRGYEWMFGPSLLATPLYGDDYATATSRDVYLPAGKWLDYDTGESYLGPILLKDFPLPVGKTPLFVGGKGVLVVRDLKDRTLSAVVYPIVAGGSTYRFTYPDAIARTAIINDNDGWNPDTLAVTDLTDHQALTFASETRTGAIRFAIKPGHDYRLTGGASKITAREKRNES